MNDKEEMTAPNTSVGADEGQSLYVSKDSIADEEAENKENLRRLREMQRLQDPSYLHTFSMNELYDRIITGRPPIIDGLLPTGTYIIAGAPKVGKSFLVAQIAYHVSTGKPLWEYPVRQGEVLYLALEDDQRRLQDRMYHMFGVEGTDSLNFAIGSRQIGDGLETQLVNYLREHPDTRLIIIDTLQKVRLAAGEAYSYAKDYEVVGQLKRFAGSKGICLLLVHHTRKQPSDDAFETISGTTGLLGCADGAFVLKKANRTDLTATLSIVSRDLPDQMLFLERDKDTLVWRLDHAETRLWEAPTDPLLEKVAALVTEEKPEWNGSPTELVEAVSTDMAANALTRYLNVNAARLKSEYNVEYDRKIRHEGRRMYLHLMGQRDGCDGRNGI